MSEVNDGVVLENSHRLTERVYFEHTDFSGVVYHARYLDFLEHGRSDYVRLLGVHHREMAQGRYGENLAFAVRHMDITFQAAARIDDVVTIETERGTLSGPKLTFNQRITRGEEELLSAVVTVVLINLEGKLRRFPAELVAQLGLK